MSSTAHKDPEQVKEHYDPEDVLKQKAKQVAEWIKNSKHAIMFTGAGVSTSAGIPDFRGPNGVWTLKAQGKVPQSRTTTLSAVPTASHMAIVKLIETGMVKHLISQNTDGLHRKSGLNPANLSELHGNSNIEICTVCRKEYFRDFRAVASYRVSVHDHITDRYCDKCGAPLMDTIINFGESLPRVPLETGFDQANQADLCLVLGSSLTVSPANDMPARVCSYGKKLIICNLQHTPLDSKAALRVYAKNDDLMKLVMQELGLEIPQWNLHRRVEITYKNSSDKSGNSQLQVRGVDWEGIPASIFKKVIITHQNKKVELAKEPFVLQLDNLSGTVNINLEFMGHYLEPNMDLNVDVAALKIASPMIYELKYNPYTRSWSYTRA